MNYMKDMLAEAGKMFARPAVSKNVGGFPRGKMFFRPQPFWQVLRDDHIASGGIEFKMGLDDGVNYAKLKTKVEIEPDSSFAKSCAKVVSDGNGKGDAEAISSVLRELVASNNIPEIMSIFQSCYVTREAASASVCEACKLDHTEALVFLLEAGCSPTSKLSGKTALHFAVESGSEESAILLVSSWLTPEEIMMPNSNDLNIFQIMENLDMGPMMRQIKKAMEPHDNPDSQA
eukprot:TRINITY_DN12761_c1_g1_i1.p1 TRINITY_DN12761_c1_g1~~TRINITY_DN12761_c1_g1_i1.p1  ORF type:complete len:232 (+),score=29.58 TRINITY_DN12761_c1_g1_i1:74-769(+)